VTGNGGTVGDFELERGSDGAMTGYAFPDILLDLGAGASFNVTGCRIRSGMTASRA
jgi:hypothetical protein